MSRSTIQVPDELKVEIENLKDELKAKTTYGVIESLIQIHKDFLNYKHEIKMEKARLEKETLEIGQDHKRKFVALKQELNLNENSSALEFLLHHYTTSNRLDKSTFELYRSLN
ncbi:hypothetical protein BK126_28275 [Paenibacillus sp. FSL H7-0326]|uniref:hypothetical protein n=1 Tax=Paenibacillus sp. FSL H7-0326 TaxID=1921144 RepID=UPI00096DC62B|nr:hypothetical protein [Paenibacillus sp. FSL H7-0326]OMC62764.1 hypothetical protein BK126_28275 [Paenibacillus sp. FSL H7-0326]